MLFAGNTFSYKNTKKSSFKVVDKDHDEVQSYIEQLMNDESSNLTNIIADQNDESGDFVLMNNNDYYFSLIYHDI